MFINLKKCNLNSFIKIISVNVVSQIRRTIFKMSSNKCLAAFDFDSTIIVDNSDTVVRDLLPKDMILKLVRKPDGWTDYMQNVFNFLHQRQIDESTITRTVMRIPPVDGMVALIKELSNTLNYDLIIISDSNSHFIAKWLEGQQLTNCFKAVFTNPGKFIEGRLNIEMYHIQDSCKLSTKNLCKGQILDDFIKSQKEIGSIYNNVVYVGDGQNDFCPILRLKSGDLACCREGYKCAEIVKDVKEKRFKDESYEVKADLLLWKDGFDILNAINKTPVQ